jgi:hypothetical protein
MYYGHSGIRINTAFVGALLETLVSPLLSLFLSRILGWLREFCTANVSHRTQFWSTYLLLDLLWILTEAQSTRLFPNSPFSHLSSIFHTNSCQEKVLCAQDPLKEEGLLASECLFVVERLLYISIPELLVDFHSEHWFFLCNSFRVLGIDWLTDWPLIVGLGFGARFNTAMPIT